MANSASAKKRIRQTSTRNKHNAMLRSRLRTHIKKVTYAAEAGEQDKASQAFKTLQPIMDQSVAKGLIHKNTAARKKSRLTAKIATLSSAK